LNALFMHTLLSNDDGAEGAVQVYTLGVFCAFGEAVTKKVLEAHNAPSERQLLDLTNKSQSKRSVS